jgi:hypothetical protein
MTHHPRNGKPQEPVTQFDYAAVLAALDGLPELPDPDSEFWALEGELLIDLCRWLTEAKTLSSIGARTLMLVLYLRPEIIKPTSLRQISKMPNAPCPATLSKALLQLEEKYGLRRSPIQKAQWVRARFSRSASVAYQNRVQTH